jgi:hypothetical protein
MEYPSRATFIFRHVARYVDACDACGEPMKYLGHCKWICLKCGFPRTCQDTI